MIKKIDTLNFYELLEVSPTATKQEIHKAYERIRRVYEPNSIALYSLFTTEEMAVMHQRIEEAYRTLVYEDNRKRYDAMLRGRSRLEEDDLPATPPPKYQPRPVQPAFSLPSDNRYIDKTTPAQPVHQQASDEQQQGQSSPVSNLISEFTGPAIKILREQRGLTIRNVADMTKISSRYLEYIEAESFNKLPARPYLRGFLALYAKALGCTPERMVGDYMKRYDAALSRKTGGA
jgi:curved DNA-binding protein CbpA